MRFSLPAALIIFQLTSTATAYAECAWVLWSVSGTIPAKELFEKRTTITYLASNWKPIRAFATAKECETTEHSSSIDAEFEMLKQLKPEGIRSPRGVSLLPRHRGPAGRRKAGDERLREAGGNSLEPIRWNPTRRAMHSRDLDSERRDPAVQNRCEVRSPDDIRHDDAHVEEVPGSVWATRLFLGSQY